MSTEVWLTFAAASWLLAWTPGPSMSLILANASSHGLRAGLTTLAGNSLGLTMLVLAAAAGMTSLMSVMAEWFDVVRVCGAAYLIYLGVTRLWRLRRRASSPSESVAQTPGGRGRAWFWQGLAVSLSNPKTLLFLGAFLPQFVDQRLPTGPQISVLAITFLTVCITADAAYTVAFARVRAWFLEGRLAILDGLSAAMLLAGGVVLALARRP